jgi:hypothetical protein
MTNYGFIDESGTHDDQCLMTVGLVILPGIRTAQNIQQKIITHVDEGYGQARAKRRKERTFVQPKLHFAEMHESQKIESGKILSQSNVRAILIGSHWHQPNSTHDERFGAYELIIKDLIVHALRKYDEEFVLNIARQGGWQTYEQSFLQRIRMHVEQHIPNRSHLLRSTALVSTVPGVQLADFCTSSARANLMHCLHAGFEHIESMIEWVNSKKLLVPMDAKR